LLRSDWCCCCRASPGWYTATDRVSSFGNGLQPSGATSDTNSADAAPEAVARTELKMSASFTLLPASQPSVELVREESFASAVKQSIGVGYGLPTSPVYTKMNPVSLRPPSAKSIEQFLNSQSKLSLTYPSVGATATTPPNGYTLDRTRIKLGQGERAFAAARAALENWKHFRLGWLEATPLEPTMRVGGVVAVAGRCMGLWWLNACRIVYTVDEGGPIARFGFAYGTLPTHAESGEERFLVEWDRQDDSVWYDILAFSRPRGLLSHLGYPRLRMLQKRFRKDSGAAMLRAATRVNIHRK
jgi:uncharacterized protein (UPF0548 family)